MGFLVPLWATKNQGMILPPSPQLVRVCRMNQAIPADVAQWQSNGFVNRRLRVRLSPSAFVVQYIEPQLRRIWEVIMTNVQKSSLPAVGIIMGSKSDWPVMQHAAETLRLLDILFEAKVVSAHRMPVDMIAYGQQAAGRGIKVIIAGAGGAAHLPGMISSVTVLPVLGVPIESSALKGLDSMLSIVQMPGGVPVGTLAIGKAGAINAALLAAAILGLSDGSIQNRYQAYRDSMTDRVRAEVLDDLPPAL